MQILTWLWTMSAAVLSAATTVSAPTRSLYSPKFFENELHTKQLGLRPAERSQAGRVFLDAVRKALIGKVQQRQQAAAINGVGQLVPLFRRGVDAGRVVATAVQQDHVAGGHLLNRRQHRVPGQAFLAASKYGKVFVGTPAAAKICGWFGQVGSVIHTVALGNC